ncbi:hypothetical protein A1O3_10487 [Capronia epimyces CBS 606.96]|uniref:NIMA interactive protein n=1 Tax=Capronia epimyces CBS 606.96 TaxID=1182542 RepID=W9X8S6_9EURO|nr:uncharacterized protein A1O3_10487 [Capronia epimyces CBS 606.96]EXJ76842.1 hypothetical protein A1O3_10487 [Capronia epimyces CBS 606.96]
MDSQSLERASHYLNNLLLARGLLSTGKPIDFARPDSDGRTTDTTMARIINLVHDLVLRRDEDAEQREILAMNIRAARAEGAQRVLDIQKLQDKNTELARVAVSAESQERALKTAARKAEARAKELKEQMLKMKSTLDQVRAKCLSDVRKRDTELDKLKAHLTGLQRGKKEASGIKINVINWEPDIKAKEKRNGEDVNCTEWSLEKESNDFLAAVLNETSTENTSLRRIITDTMAILSDLTGLSQAADDTEGEEATAIPGQFRKSSRERGCLSQELTSCAVLADQMSTILEHCQSILKDPSFVPIEEVHVRDEEIIKLRAGWEKMATKWKEAVTMMDDWRRRAGHNGEGLSDNDFAGLEFGEGVAMLPNGHPVFGADEEVPSVLYENSNAGDEAIQEAAIKEMRHPSLQGSFDTEDHQESDLDIPPEPTTKRLASSPRKARLNIGKPVRPLRAIDHNMNASPRRNVDIKYCSKHPAELGLDPLDGQWETGDDVLQPKADFRTAQKTPTKHTLNKDEDSQRHVRRGEEATLTVAEKLAVVEAEACQARSRPQRTKKRKQVDTQRVKRGSGRRSTLSPEELAVLIGIE